LFVLLVLTSAATLRAQAVRATIQGTIKDAGGAALPGASIDVRNVATGAVQSAVALGQTLID
jgi:hypothetical protein